MKRREFIKTAGVIAGSTVASEYVFGKGIGLASESLSKQPNILFIMTDQQSADAMSCRIGGQYLRTPAMDSLAANGMSFTRAYTANPLCIPARTSLFTGQCPHTTGIQYNDTNASLVGKYPCLGNIFRDAGYDTGYFGKWHLPYPSKDSSSHGFDTMASIKNDGMDSFLPGHADKFLKQKRSTPFLLVTSFVNPHNICEWPRGEVLKNGSVGDPPPADQCPPRVKNYQPMENETEAMLVMRRAYQGSSKFPVGDFDEKKWRQYRWAYFRMIEMVDSHIEKILTSLRESNQHENTLIVFTSDHGDCQGAHGWNQKTVLYDESSRVPFIISLPGQTSPGTTDQLINTGIDLLPTLADFAGIKGPKQLPGISLKNTSQGNIAADPRKYIVAEDKLTQGVPVDGKKSEPSGRMVRSKNYKYCTFDTGVRNESLIDMENDPGETKNLAGKKEYSRQLEQHREYLTEWCRTTNDNFIVPGK